MKTGDMPDGNMSVKSLPSTRLPGHEGCGTIEITYNFRPGVYVSCIQNPVSFNKNYFMFVYRMAGDTMPLLFHECATSLIHIKDKR